jgi:hypothetical protein
MTAVELMTDDIEAPKPRPKNIMLKKLHGQIVD